MARYRKIDVRIHSDEKVRRLSGPQPNAKSLWFYLLTNRHTTNIPGLYEVSEATIADELEWSMEGFRKGFSELVREGMVKADWSARLVWIPNAIRYDEPSNSNVIKGWQITWDELPECKLKDEAYQYLSLHVKGLGEWSAKGFNEWFIKPYQKGNQKGNATPEPEPEPEPDRSKDLSASPTSIVLKKDDDVFRVYEHHRLHHPRSLAELKKTSKEHKQIRARLAEGFTVEQLCSAIDGFNADSWVIETGQTAKLEYLTRTKSLVEQYLERSEHGPPASKKFLSKQDQSFVNALQHAEKFNAEVRARNASLVQTVDAGAFFDVPRSADADNCSPDLVVEARRLTARSG